MGKRQHVVPQLHLRRFVGTDPKDHIWSYDKQTGAVRSSLVDNTAFETHLYSVTRNDGTRDTRIENMLARMESNAGPKLDKFIRGAHLSGHERAEVASFFALTYVRTNAFRRTFAQVKAARWQSKLYAIAQDQELFDRTMSDYVKGSGPVTEEFRERVRQAMIDPACKFKFEVNRETTLDAIGMHDQIVEVIYDMSWMLLRVPDGSYLITSDNPAVVSLHRTHGTAIGGRLTDPRTRITVPLSPCLCWIGHWDKYALATGHLPPETVSILNRERARAAERFLFAHKRDDTIAELAASHKDSKVALKISGGGPREYAEVILSRR